MSETNNPVRWHDNGRGPRVVITPAGWEPSQLTAALGQPGLHLVWARRGFLTDLKLGAAVAVGYAASTGASAAATGSSWSLAPRSGSRRALAACRSWRSSSAAWAVGCTIPHGGLL